MSRMKFYYKSKNRNLIMIKQQNHYNPLKKEKSLVWDKGIWNKACLEDITATPEPYIITEGNGRIFRCNQRIY